MNKKISLSLHCGSLNETKLYITLRGSHLLCRLYICIRHRLRIVVRSVELGGEQEVMAFCVHQGKG